MQDQRYDTQPGEREICPQCKEIFTPDENFRDKCMTCSFDDVFGEVGDSDE